MKALTAVVMGLITLCVFLPEMIDRDKQINHLRQDSISTHAENAQLKRQLQKVNSDTTHKHCINLKPE